MTTATVTPSATIRNATPADIPRIVAMGMRFATTEYADFMSATPESLTRLAEQLLANETSTIFVSDRDSRITGMLAMVTYEQPMSGQMLATELAWWMEPDARGSRDALRLLRAGENWARSHGAMYLQMIAPTDHVGQFYERLGFRRVETHYQRTL